MEEDRTERGMKAGRDAKIEILAQVIITSCAAHAVFPSRFQGVSFGCWFYQGIRRNFFLLSHISFNLMQLY